MDGWASQHWGPSNSGFPNEVHYLPRCSCIRTNLNSSVKIGSFWRFCLQLAKSWWDQSPLPLRLSATKILRERPYKIPVTKIHRWHKQWEESELFATKVFFWRIRHSHNYLCVIRYMTCMSCNKIVGTIHISYESIDSYDLRKLCAKQQRQKTLQSNAGCLL